MNAPILRIAQNVRRYFKPDVFRMSSQNVHKLERECHTSIDGKETRGDDPERRAVGLNLSGPSAETETPYSFEPFRDK